MDNFFYNFTQVLNTFRITVVNHVSITPIMLYQIINKIPCYGFFN